MHASELAAAPQAQMPKQKSFAPLANLCTTRSPTCHLPVVSPLREGSVEVRRRWCPSWFGVRAGKKAASSWVRVVSLPALADMPSETQAALQFALGRILEVQGVDQYGHLELLLGPEADRALGGFMNTIWLEPTHTVYVSGPSRMKRLYEARHSVEAHLVQQHLSRAGIHAEVRGETIPFPGDSIAGFGGNAQSVWVDDQQFDEARAILDEVVDGGDEA